MASMVRQAHPMRCPNAVRKGFGGRARHAAAGKPGECRCLASAGVNRGRGAASSAPP
jgi:hypothetical protein